MTTPRRGMDEGKETAMPIAPTLILGLGGTGSQIIEKVSEKVRETGTKQGERIAYVAFDTDINDLADIQRRSPHIRTVQTSTRSTVGEYLNINTNARDNWFPVNGMLNRKTLTEGAAQVRAISRLAFDTTLKGGNLDGLHSAIDDLFRIDKDQEEQALRVIITSSLAGGTGSGLILPVAMYLSNYLRTKFPRANAITRGFFIQPDVFYGVIPATEEQRNLQVNAYAAVRELDAFLMKGDDTLPEQYRDLVFEFPKVAADGTQVINAMPYDFCFLFDSNNTSGGGLDSFESYKDHAATCIYTQSLGPMSKRSNSREDNVLREVIKNDGRNRYAGAGASRLVYPWRHLRDYVAHKWLDQALSKQWLTFDEQIRDLQEAQAQQREEGFSVQDIDRGEKFVDLLESASRSKDAFARVIESQCLIYDEDGLVVTGNRWSEYIGALKEYATRPDASTGLTVLRSNADNTVSALATSKDREDYASAYGEIKRFHDLMEKRTEEKAGVIGYTLFKSENASVTKDKHAHHLETYLREKSTDRFVHPVAARYFLYKTYAVMVAEKKRVDRELDNSRDFFKSFESTTFRDSRNDEEQSPAEWATARVSISQRLRRKPGAGLVNMREDFFSYIRRVDKLQEQLLYSKVLEEGIAYVKGLSDSFEILFNSLEEKVARLRSEIELLRTRYDGLKGSTTRYVLANSTSLDFMYRSMPYAGGVATLDSGFSEGIYNSVRQYHMLNDDKDATYFTDLYKNDILGYFQDEVVERHQTQLSLDIIEALEREHSAAGKSASHDDVVHYVVAEIEKVKGLSAPFIEQPIGEERHPIRTCAYNKKIEGESDPRRKTLVDEHLGDYGGQRDDEISPQEVLFYNAIYGIRARDLSKYAPERTDATDRRPAGAYFSAYHQLVAGIRPSVTTTRVITPHIDRRWHTIAALPDLDDRFQRDQVTQVHHALFSGLTSGAIFREHLYEETFIYRYHLNQSVDQDFVVSNGTPCDQFYEVLDALTIDPIAVADVLDVVEAALVTYVEESAAVTYAGSPLDVALRNGIHLDQLPEVVPGMRDRRATLFDVAAFYALTVPKEEYFDTALRDLAVDIYQYTQSYVHRLEAPTEAVPVLTEVFFDQFRAFRANSEHYLTVAGAPFARKIRTIIRPFGELARDLHMSELRAEVAAFETKLQGG